MNSGLRSELFARRCSSKFYRDVRVYYINLKGIADWECKYFMNKLNDEEKNRAAKMVPSVAKKFIACRAIGKQALCDQLNINNVTFSYLKYGKPYIQHYQDIYFNISHSKDLAVLGISLVAPIGIDIEFIDQAFEWKDLMNLLMSKEEKSWILKENSICRFFAIWTMKEAILKQKGEGITFGHFPKIEIRKNSFYFQNREIQNFNVAQKNYTLSIFLNN